ncbi:MAG: hypothetical protein WBW74_20055 [Xanthobacteraceae bacterium]
MTTCCDTPEALALAAPSAAGFRFSRLFPLFVGERQSSLRGLKVGWYAIDNDGAVAAGPYPSRDACDERIGQAPDASISPDLWRRPDSIRYGAANAGS